MNKKLLVIIASCLSAAVMLAVIAGLLAGNSRLNKGLASSQKISEKMQAELSRLQADKEKMSKENEKLQSDADSYASSNTKLQEERDGLQNSLIEAENNARSFQESLLSEKQKLDELEKKINEGHSDVKIERLRKERIVLAKKISAMDAVLKEERALYHYNLAVAYMQAKFYDEAAQSFEKSLTFNPANSDAHYNLGLIYANIKSDPLNAVEHYRRYLELKPNAEDKEEVLGWIQRMER